MNLKGLVTAYESLSFAEADLKELIEDFIEEKKEIEDKIKEHHNVIAQYMDNLDISKIKTAEKILEVKGRLDENPSEQFNVIKDAINDIINGGEGLWTQYFATKYYDSFYHQRCDNPYGHGPKHGYITFAVGLSKGIREREHKFLFEHEIEACVYYLTNLAAIQKVTVPASGAV